MRNYIFAAALASFLGGCVSGSSGTTKPAEPLTPQMRQQVARYLSNSIIFSSIWIGRMNYVDAKVGLSTIPLFYDRPTYCVIARVVPGFVSQEYAMGAFWALNTKYARIFVDSGKVTVRVSSDVNSSCSFVGKAEPFPELEQFNSNATSASQQQKPEG